MADLGEIIGNAEVEGGKWLVATSYAVAVVGADGVVDAGLWHEVQFCRWTFEDRHFTLVWVDPERPGVDETTVSADVGEFMKALTQAVERTIVLRKKAVAVNGTEVVASARRRVDGEIFTTVVVRGEVSDEVEAIARDLEQQVQGELGLDRQEQD